MIDLIPEKPKIIDDHHYHYGCTGELLSAFCFVVLLVIKINNNIFCFEKFNNDDHHHHFDYGLGAMKFNSNKKITY